jgi:Mrp family chromosome partitioning ATPase
MRVTEMGKYYQALQRLRTDQEPPRVAVAEPVKTFTFTATDAPNARAVAPVAQPWSLPNGVGGDALRSITERLAPLAAVENSMRLIIGGCSHGAGASTVAAALALDLSERLYMRTLLIDAHLQRPMLEQMFAGMSPRPVALIIDGAVQVRQTCWPRLYVATSCPFDEESDIARMHQDFEKLSARYQATIVDIGVPRLDPRMLMLARANDPILLVVRYGQTERCHLETTTAALQSAGRSIAGVVFNAKPQLISKQLGRFINNE